VLLAVDVGNTNIVLGLFSGNTLVGSFRMMTNERKTSDEIGLLVDQFFRRLDQEPAAVEAVIIASVVPHVMPALTSAMINYVGKKLLIVDDSIFPEILYEGNERLGADRSVACDAAAALYGKPLILLDLGTATTVDAISHDGWYLGGCILAGLKTALEALTAKTAALPRVELAHPGTVLGMNAVSQMQAGALIGYLGTIERLIQDTRREMGYGDSVKVVATGGLAHLIADHTNLIDVVDDDLILKGLCMMYDKYLLQSATE